MERSPVPAAAAEGYSSSPVQQQQQQYSLHPCRLLSEDILFCIDSDLESRAEMKVLSGPKGRPITRMDTIKQALVLFINAKLTICGDHRFSFSSLSSLPSWPHKEFSNRSDYIMAAVRALKASDTSYDRADLTQLFRMASHESKKSRAQGRLLRVILVYCRSSTKPQHQWPVSPKLFTMDVIYLHDKPSTENCPQKVYDALVDSLEHVSEYEGYIYESGQGLARVLFRHMCTLLAHPQQRCAQDDLHIPKPIAKKSPPSSDAAPSEDTTVPSQ